MIYVQNLEGEVKMKLLLLSNMFPNNENPTYGTFVKSSYDQLKNIYPIVDKIVMTKKNASMIDKFRDYWRFYKKAVNQIKKKEYDLIYIHYISHTSIPLLFVKKKFKIVSNVHGSDILPKRQVQKFLIPVVKKILKKSDLVVVPSEYFKKIVEYDYKVECSKIFVSPSGGINSTVFFPPKEKKINNRKLKIGFASRIEPEKGWETYLEAIALLNDGEFSFSIVGSGSDKKKLDQLIKDKQLNEKIEIQNSLPQSQLREYFSDLDCFIFPSKNESLGLIGLEAMACGCAVIGANNEGITSYLENRYNGFIFEMGNSNDLADKIIDYSLLTIDEKKEMSQNAIKTARKYDSLTVEKLLDNRLERLISFD